MDDERELVKQLGTRFIARKDVKAVMGERNPFDGEIKEWQPVKKGKEYEPFQMQDFRDHFAGTRTFGHYLVDPATQTCKLFAFDLDLNAHGNFITRTGEVEPWSPREVFVSGDNPEGKAFLTIELHALAEMLSRTIRQLAPIPVAVATSGRKGLHVYGFTGTMPADKCRMMALRILDYLECFDPYRGDSFFYHKEREEGIFPNTSVEIFPKQESVSSEGFWNLMALPLGIHKGTGQRKEFVRFGDDRSVIEVMDPIAALSGTLPWE